MIMATKSPTDFHNHWGTVAAPINLPVSANVEVGDTCYVTSDSGQYCCTTAGGLAWQRLKDPMLSGVGSPSGSITGNFGQTYYETGSGIMYVCVSSPSGTTWVVT